MKLKTHVPDDRKKGVVYEVPCKDCRNTYVGETKGTLRVRLGEHKQAVHAHETQHEINWSRSEEDGSQILEEEDL